MHAPPPNLRRPLGLLPTALLLLAGLAAAARRGIRQVLNNRAVDRELVPALALVCFERSGRGRGFGYQGLQDRVDYAVVPGCGLGVLVGCCGGEGGGAG